MYVHFPWCIKKCPYCDFNSHTVKASIPETQYVDKLLEDLAMDVEQYGISRPVSSIFMGGGTPSLLSPEAIDCLLRGIEQQLVMADDIEITLEANPGTFESNKFAEFRAIGINRLSIGVQSFDDRLLTNLGRVHSGQEAVKAAEIAHQAGFDNFNLDLMYGLPGATVDTSISDMTTAVSLEPTHISFYQMTLEPNTYFYRFPPPLPHDELIYAIQKRCQALLADEHYAQYEISAYSRTGRQCRHNVNYWQFGDYLGIGAGAHGKLTQALPNQITRTFKPKSPAQYLAHSFEHADVQVIALADLPLEFVMNHLRLRQGFSLAAYQAATGLAVATLEPALSQCVQENLLIKQDNRYYCSERGWNFLDSILEKFMP
ncbi:putative oxidoreductase [Crenothrix polyspora]|uniref:Heme chaperone HemW n=1 Tax=Crenothrix polyspora TaxID=360316 RepID=A0A1R4HHR4_9GAMM|nr:putative oxidoreductase [Crenothrix polyspora]